jgi:hypothetical protein
VQKLATYPDVKGIMLRGSDGKVWLLHDKGKHWVMTPDAFKRLNLDWNRIVALNQTDFNAYPEGAPVE